MDQMVEEKHLNDIFPYLDNIAVARRSQEEHDRNVRKFLNAISRRNMTLNKSKTVHVLYQHSRILRGQRRYKA